MVRTIKLNDNKVIPSLGWGNGTGGINSSSQKAVDSGVAALKAGILHIDTAQSYRTEEETGEAIKKAGLSKNQVWVTTKISKATGVKSTPKDIERSVKESLDKLGFIPDLLLIHSPFEPEKGKLQLFWQCLEGLVEDGTLKGCSLGVSNFRPQDLKEVLEIAKIKPAVQRGYRVSHGGVVVTVEIEYHPFVLTHLDPVLKIQEKHHIVTQAYGPLAPLLRHPTKGGPLKPILSRIAERLTKESGHEVDSAGVLLLWTMQKGVCAITTSGNPENLKKMAALNEVPDLTKEEMDEIETTGRKIHFRGEKYHMTTDFPAPDLPEDF